MACSQSPKKTKVGAKTKIVRKVKLVNGVPVRVRAGVPRKIANATGPAAATGGAQTAALGVAAGSAFTPNPAPVTVTPPPYTARSLDSASLLTDIAFGSWANQEYPQPIWSAIQDSKPNLFVFVGDTIKLEDRTFSEQYAKLDSINEYRSLRESVPFLAVWNTQDYRVDNGQKSFSNYWSYLKTSVSEKQTGIYHSQVVGPTKRQVQFILLDTRSFRGPRLAGEKPNAPVLGEEQWRWLEEQMKQPTEVKFLVSSIPLIPARQDGESWNNYPVERQRLFDLIKKIRPRHLAVISGGARQGSVATTGLKGWGPLFDISTGPLNDVSDRPAEEDERIQGPTITSENFAVAQIDWQNRLVVLKILDSKRVIINSTTQKIR